MAWAVSKQYLRGRVSDVGSVPVPWQDLLWWPLGLSHPIPAEVIFLYRPRMGDTDSRFLDMFPSVGVKQDGEMTWAVSEQC